MDYGKLVSRAFEITRKYRALWLFGVLLALFGGGGGGGSFNFANFGGRGGRGMDGEGLPGLPALSSETMQLIVVLLVALMCLAIIWILLSIILRFVSRAALIGLVQELEANEKTPTVRRGLHIGAERFWSLLGIALTINIPLAIVSLTLILIALAPMLATLIPMINAGRGAPSELVGIALSGVFGSILLICCVVLILALIGLIIHPFYEFIVRTCVVAKRGVMDSIREGYRLVRANLGNVAVLYILVIGIGIGFGLLMIPMVLMLIAIPAGAGVLVYALANSITGAIIAGVILGIPMLLILIFLSGLFQVFVSALWTEGYLTVTATPRA